MASKARALAAHHQQRGPQEKGDTNDTRPKPDMEDPKKELPEPANILRPLIHPTFLKNKKVMI